MDRMVTLAHKFLEDVLSFGDTAVDLTAGGGRDTLFLAERTGRQGKVFAFDIQREAIVRTQSLLTGKGFRAISHWEEGSILPESGIFLVNDGHERIRSYVRENVKGVITKHGYLPSGDRSIVTRAETTLQSLRETLPLLVSGGRLAVIAYVRHQGGRREAEEISGFFGGLPSKRWHTIKMEMLNRENAPFLLMAEKT